MNVYNLVREIKLVCHNINQVMAIECVNVIDPYCFLSTLMAKMRVDVKIFDLNDPTPLTLFQIE